MNGGPLPDLRDVERRLDRLQARAETLSEEYLRTRTEGAALDEFLDLAPQASATLEALSASLFGEVLDEIEGNLTHAVREILGQDREVRTERTLRGGRLYIEFRIFNQGEPEDVLTGQGGSVCNILSVGLRFIALSQLDEARHRPFLVLDEQDCWLKPQLVPRFMKMIRNISKKLGIQALVISHHQLDLFSCDADRVYRLRPDRKECVALDLLTDRSAPALSPEDDATDQLRSWPRPLPLTALPRPRPWGRIRP